MTAAEVREFRLISVDGRSLPADFRIGDEWIEVIGGTLRGATYTIELDTGLNPFGNAPPVTPEDGGTIDLTLTLGFPPAKVPQGPHTYRFQEQPGESK